MVFIYLLLGNKTGQPPLSSIPILRIPSSSLAYYSHYLHIPNEICRMLRQKYLPVLNLVAFKLPFKTRNLEPTLVLIQTCQGGKIESYVK